MSLLKEHPRDRTDEMKVSSEGGDAVSQATPPKEEVEPKKPSDQIMRHELKEAQDALDRSNSRIFFSSFAAGLELGFSLLLMARIHSLKTDELPLIAKEILIAMMYSFGFVLVVIGRSELFTEQTSLAVLPVLNRKASIGSLLRLWSIVYVGNLAGAAAMAALLVQLGPGLGIVDPQVFGQIARRVVDHPAGIIVGSGIFAGWLMGLLSWLVAAGRDTISQIVIVGLITTTIGLNHLHHVVAGSVEVLAGLFSSRDVTWADFGHFLLWTTVGNATGGPIFVALLKFAVAPPPGGQNTVHQNG